MTQASAKSSRISVCKSCLSTAAARSQLVGLAPNVKSNAGPHAERVLRTAVPILSAFSINGGPTALNLVLVERAWVATQSYYPDLNADLAVDAVQEFKVSVRIHICRVWIHGGRP